MKIYFNRKPVVGPWGGGNKTLSALIDNLQDNNEIVYQLCENIDLIFCFDPRPNSYGEWYQDFYNYKIKNPTTKIIQRVGDVGTHSKPDLTRLVKQTVNYSDHMIFPSKWAKDYIGFKKDNFAVIHNAPIDVFYENNVENTERKKSDKVRIVTHHWSDNPKKGFDVYSELGELIQNNFKDELEFTYIGRFNNDFKSSGITLKPPIDALSLSKELIKHDIYLTASLEEAGANHVLEAMACKLPILYRKGGGSINEYCLGMGQEYTRLNKENLTSIIKKMMETKYNTYNNSIKNVIEEYTKVINEVVG